MSSFYLHIVCGLCGNKSYHPSKTHAAFFNIVSSNIVIIERLFLFVKCENIKKTARLMASFKNIMLTAFIILIIPFNIKPLQKSRD